MTMVLQYSRRRILQRWAIIIFFSIVIWWRVKWPAPHELTLSFVSDNIPLMVFLLVLLGISTVYLLKAFLWKPPILIDSEGVQDTRLKIGVLPWKQIRSAKIQTAYGATLVLLQLKEPASYIKRLPLLPRIMAKWYRLDDSGDLYMDLSELAVNSESVLETISQKIHSENAA